MDGLIRNLLYMKLISQSPSVPKDLFIHFALCVYVCASAVWDKGVGIDDCCEGSRSERH
jgi:hypothetical protein